MNINVVHIAGRLTKKPEVRVTPNGKNVANFSVATNYKYQGTDGNKVEETEFHNVVTFGKTAENIAKYFNKGDEIYIQGRLKTNQWEKDGVKKSRTEIIADKFDFGQKSKANQGDHSQPEAVAEEAIQVEDIPF